MKKCSRCKLDLNTQEFQKNKCQRDGLENWCKKCKNKWCKEYYAKNIDTIRKKHETHNRKNVEYRKKYRKINKTKIKEANEKWRDKNKEHLTEYRKINKDRDNKRNSDWRKKRIKVNIQFKLSLLLRVRFNSALKGNYKNGSAVKDLGCSIEELKTYLENKFVDGMTWENHGKWHIDHIIPISSFNLLNREELLKAVNYKNLQPLWKNDNLSKSNKIL